MDSTNVNVTIEGSSHSTTPMIEENNINSSSRTSPTRKAKMTRKKMAPRSKVWAHFSKYNEDGVEKARCNYCNKELSASTANGTSTLKNHTYACPNGPNKIGNQTEIVQVGSGSLSTWKYDENAIRIALSRMIIVDELPFKFVEGEGFRDLFVVACPRFHIPFRRTVTRDCYDLFISERDKLKSFIKQTYQSVCLTTDTWTSIQRVNYMCLTCHFIDKNWQLQKKILNFCPIDSHKGDAIGKAVEMYLLAWGIDRVFTVTVDNASSNDTGISFLKRRVSNWGGCPLNGKWMHMRCIAHIINLIVTEGLKEVNVSIDRIRAAIKFVRHSPSRLKRFKECVQREKIESRKLLCLDVSTRWNSTYLMLDSAIKFERAFERFGDCDPYFIKDLTGEKRPGVPTAFDWDNARRMVQVLEHFYELTIRISGSLYVTSNDFFHEISDVECLLNEWIIGNDFDLSFMGQRMKEKYDKYWGDVKKINMLIYIAVIIDPRHKLVFVEHSLKRLYPGEVGFEMANLVKESMYEFFKDYCDRLGVQVHAKRSTVERSNESSQIKKRMVLAKQFKKQIVECGGFDNKSELDKYLTEGFEEDSDDFNILEWWKVNTPRFPILSHIARDVLAIPISTVASEAAFSTGGRVLDPFRSSLTPRIVEALVCTQDWSRRSSKVNVEESLEELEELEKEFSFATLEDSST